MTDNAQLLFQELLRLNYDPKPFACPLRECSGGGVKFRYQIVDGSRSGEIVTLGLFIPSKAGSWPEATPHWVHISPPDDVLEEQVRAHRSNGQGTVKRYKDEDGVEWMAISAPVKDFWDQIEETEGKNMTRYIDRHVRRIWSAR